MNVQDGNSRDTAMTQQTRDFIENLTRLPDALQDRYVPIFNRLMKEFTGGDGAIDEPVLEENNTVTFNDIKHLLGVYDNLPPDLSSNPRKYMEGFGAKSMGHKE